MGTRGFVGFVADEKETIAYNHFDSYPSGVGVHNLKFVARLAADGETLEKYRVLARDIQHVSDDVPPTREDVVRLAQFANLNVSQKNLYTEWYGLLRETQGSAAATLECGVVENCPDFPKDSLFCEWGYLINFDTQKFEVYQGWQTEPVTKGRWAGLSPEPRYEGDTNTYKAVKLVASYDFYDLPTATEFLRLDVGEEDE